MQPMTIKEFKKFAEENIKKEIESNSWKYNKKLNTISYNGHEIDLCRIDKLPKDKRGLEILDWIFHIGGKRWASDKVQKDLIFMFRLMYKVFPTSKITINKEYR